MRDREGIRLTLNEIRDLQSDDVESKIRKPKEGHTQSVPFKILAPPPLPPATLRLVFPRFGDINTIITQANSSSFYLSGRTHRKLCSRC